MALVWGIIRIVADRSGGQYISISSTSTTGGLDVSDEDLWGFGQVVTVMLLISPFVTFFGLSYGEFTDSDLLQQTHRTYSNIHVSVSQKHRPDRLKA